MDHALEPRGAMHGPSNSRRVLLHSDEEDAATAAEAANSARSEPGARSERIVLDDDARAPTSQQPAAAAALTVPRDTAPASSSGDASQSALPCDAAAARARHRHHRVTVGLLCAFVTMGYAFAMFVNGIAAQLSPAAPRIDAATALPPVLAALYAQLDGLFTLAFYRCCAAAALVAFMACRGDAPAAPTPLDRRLAWPFLMGLANAGGYLPYMILVGSGGVALWSSLVGCYVVIPVAYGLCVRREGRSPRKLAGIAACVAAVTMLSLAQSAASEGDAPAAASAPPLHPAVAALLFVSCVLVWAACDTIASYIARPPDALHVSAVVAGAGAGFGALALACAALSRALEAGAPPAPAAASPPPATPPAPAAWWAGQAALAAAQVLGVLAQYGTVLLGRHGADASSFLPLTSTYTALVALMGVALLGERMAGVGYAGIAVGAGGVLLIASAG